MSDLVAFLNARLREDEALRDRALEKYAAMGQFIAPEDIQLHSLAEFTGKRLNREVEAKRRILDRYLKLLDERKLHPDDLALDGAVLGMHGTVRTLTAIYSDHPDYDPAWAWE